MQSLRFVAIFAVFASLPLFALAQTSTTTAEQPTETFQKEIDRIIQEYLDAAPTSDELLEEAIDKNLEVTTTPKNPGPNETIKITIQSYLTDLNKARIAWTLNNKTVLSGIGERTFSFTNADDGKTTTLSVSITTNTGSVITKKFSWNPVGVTLFWEADTYTPPFYKGKPLLSSEARVKVIATPDKTNLKNPLGANNLVYIWEKKGTVDANSSGYGKNSYVFSGPKPFSTTNVTVQVSSVDNTINSSKKIDLPTTKPFILLYENNPLLGVVYNKPLSETINLSKKELSVSSAPFFFSNEPADSQTMQYKWLVNGRLAQNEGRNITLRNETGELGTAQVSLSVLGLRQTFQSANKSLRINFTESPTSKPIF